MLDEWNAVYIMHDGRKINLSWNELYILEYMIEHKERLTTKKELTEAVYGKGSFIKKHKGINSYIARLRKKLAGEIEITNRTTIGYKIKYIGE